MLDMYLLSLLSIMLLDYGFRTRKSTISQLTAPWKPGQTLVRIVFWVLALVWLFIQASQKWPVLVLFLFAWMTSEIVGLILRLRSRKDKQGNYSLGRPLTHLFPFLFALLPAAIAGLFATRLFPNLFTALQDYPSFALKVAVSLVAMFSWSTMFTVSVVGLVRSQKFSDDIEPHLGAGEVIGILERIFTVVLVLAGGLSAVGFAVAAKAAARYPQFKNSAFAEYFLIGTLCSVGVSLLAGLAISIPL
jgi:hypothetical protein